MKYYLIAGERSGDLHASNLMKALQQEDRAADFRFLGGDQMATVGGNQYRHFAEISFMGIWEVVKNLGAISRNLKECTKDILAFQPDVVILVDFSGFNMRIAKAIRKQAPHIHIHYYISPKLWAWNQGRAYKVKALIDHMYVIMPFEKDFYKKYGYQVDYVGNPILDAIAAHHKPEDFRKLNGLTDEPIIAVLPGSRYQEVVKMLDLMMEIRPQFSGFQFVIAAVTNLPAEMYDRYKQEGVVIVYDAAYDLLSEARAAVVTSGTATLETALFEVPEVVCYKTSWLTYTLARLLVKIKFISLVNLIADKEVVKELIQGELTKENLASELEKVAFDGAGRINQLADYKALKQLMGDPGASLRTARLIVQYLKK